MGIVGFSQAELHENPVHVFLDSPLGDDEPLRYPGVVMPLSYELEHFGFPRGVGPPRVTRSENPSSQDTSASECPALVNTSRIAAAASSMLSWSGSLSTWSKLNSSIELVGHTCRCA